jgi:hypothetical protein
MLQMRKSGKAIRNTKRSDLPLGSMLFIGMVKCDATPSGGDIAITSKMSHGPQIKSGPGSPKITPKIN